MRRWGFAALVLALGLGGAGALDALDPPSPSVAPASTVSPSGGTWVCPVASVGRGGGYVILANPGAAPSAARVVLVPDRGRSVALAVTVPAGSSRAVSVHRRTKLAVGAIVQYAGGDLVAFHSIALNEPQLGAGASAAACGRPGPVDVAVPGGRTAGAESVLAFLNPGSADAVVTVRLVAGRDVIQPQRLTRRVVPAGRRLLVRLGDFAFDRRDVTALIRFETGRAVAEALVLGRAVSLMPAVEPARTVVVPVGASGAGGLISVTSAGDDDTDLTSRVLSAGGQGRARGFPTVLRGLTARAVGIDDATGRRPPVGYLLSSNAGSPLVAAARWTIFRAPSSEVADDTAAAPARRWVGALPVFSGTASVQALVVNPGDGPARVRLRLLTETGPRTLPAMEVGGGRLDAAILADVAGVYGVEAIADRPVVVGLWGAGGAAFLQAYAATAVPIVPLRASAVELDARVGVPAPESP